MLPHRLLMGAMWTAAQAHEHRMGPMPAVRHAGGRAVGLPGVETGAGCVAPVVDAHQLPSLAVPAAYPVCPRAMGLLPLALVPDDGALQLARPLLYRLYRMPLTVLAARMVVEEATKCRGNAACRGMKASRGTAANRCGDMSAARAGAHCGLVVHCNVACGA